MPISYKEAVAFINRIPKYSEHAGIENAGMLLDELGHPEHRLNIIHVAGTNGKGSVCAFLADMLTGLGLRTGLFTSPHLVDERERIQLDRKQITEEDFAACFLRVRNAVYRLEEKGYTGITYFDYFFAIAMVWYDILGTDYVIVETGLGGRCDSTNAVAAPLLTVITSISLDHTEVLGDTLAKIASEKSGIIKPGIPLVYCCDEPEACGIILKTAAAQHAPCIGIGRSNCTNFTGKENGQLSFTFTLTSGGLSDFSETLAVNSSALYQAENAALAYTAALVLSVLSKTGYPSSYGNAETLAASCPFGFEAKYEVFCDFLAVAVRAVPDKIRNTMRAALAHSVWEGRFEQIAPDVYIDGAHNADGIRMLLSSFRPLVKQRTAALLFTAVKEKDTEQMIREICESGLFDTYFVTTIEGSRAIAPETLKAQFEAFTDAPVTAFSSPQEAFFSGMDTVKSSRKPFLIAGSLYLVGIIKELSH